MSPRRGGEADKVGNRYELAWVVRHALYCIHDARFSLTVEEVDADLSFGSEFTYEGPQGPEAHQLKRQSGDSNGWSIRALATAGVLSAAAHHVVAGRRFCFSSLIPCGPLEDMADKARRSESLASYVSEWLTADQRRAFDNLVTEESLGSPDLVWTMLRGTSFEVHGETDVNRVNAVLAQLSLSGAAGSVMALAIGAVILHNLGRRLGRTELLDALAPHGIRAITAIALESARDRVRASTTAWKSAVERGLLVPAVRRPEVQAVTAGLDKSRAALVLGGAGSGKSAVLRQVVTSLEAADSEVLVFRLDRLDPFSSTADLGGQLGFDMSPVAALAIAAADRKAVLVIDQLDAVSLASGRMPDSCDVVMDLLEEARSLPNVRVVVACRRFDAENDHRLRTLAGRDDVESVEIGLLAVDDVESIVARLGLDPAQLSSAQREVLRTPLHLVLLATTASDAAALEFRTAASLFDAFYEHKLRATKARRPGVRFHAVLARVAAAASQLQALSVPVEVLDADDLTDDAGLLLSEHVLTRDRNRIGFFHETFFDYVFARQWAADTQSLVGFLVAGEQELFRRAQVRQVLLHLRERDPRRFLDEVEAVLSADGVRFHIKATVLAVLSALDDPTSEAAAVVLHVAGRGAAERRLWSALRRPQWFLRFAEDSLIGRWLDSKEPVEHDRALDLMASAARTHPEVLTELLRSRRDDPRYFTLLRWVCRFARVSEHRPLFDLLLEAVRRGEYDDVEHLLWISAIDLVGGEPSWGLELLMARVAEHPVARHVDPQGRVTVLGLQEHTATELAQQAATADPLAFAQAVVPFLREVISATADPAQGDGLRRDPHFSWRVPGTTRPGDDLGDVLFDEAQRALEAVAASTPDLLLPLLEILAADRLYSCQFLLYKALAAGGAAYADWAADLLVGDPSHLDCGYLADARWVAREVVAAIAPHVTEDTHRRLEDRLRDWRAPREYGAWSGAAAFSLLSALDEGWLTALGHRRLAEYRRKFGATAPEPPPRMEASLVQSPIGDDATRKMSDEQWLRAMRKHSTAGTDWSTFTGGARELSHALRRRVTEDPLRFAQLALRLTADLNPAYADAVLMGLGDADVVATDSATVFAAVRSIARLAHPDNDRWLGWALQRHYARVPVDLVELLCLRALYSSDPRDNTSLFVRGGSQRPRATDLHTSGMNSGRGSAADAVGDILIHDVDGLLTRTVRPHLTAMAADPVLSVRSCVAHTLAAALRHARPDAVAAFTQLIDVDDGLLAADSVQSLMIYIGNVDPDVIEPVVQRMLASDDDEVRAAGGSMAAFAALEWDRTDLLQQSLDGDPQLRKGIAAVCSGRIDRTGSVALATSTLVRLFHDPDEEVREAAARVAMELRGRPLEPHERLVSELIASPAYRAAVPQVLITLQQAPDGVGGLVLTAAERFLKEFGAEAADISTGASADAHYISDLVVRGLSQARERDVRSALLDVLDGLLENGVYGIDDAIQEFERP